MEANKEMRAVYAETLLRLGAKDKNIVVLEADLMKATGTGPFAKAYPERVINVGVAEANLVGIASGMSAEGKIPFAATFACFASRRAYDQFFVSANYARLNVKLVGTDPGVCAAANGGTHMPFEDLALMRAIPHLVIVEPSDPVSLAAIVELAAGYKGCVYIRLQRKAAPVLYPEGESFEFGKAKLLKEGEHAVIVALGALMVGEALKAAETLAAAGKKVAVIDALSLKPLDEELILTWAAKTGRIISCENHQKRGALGSAVAEAIAESGTVCKFARIGVDDEFGEVGSQDWLADHFKLTAPHIVAAVQAL
ncbi:MAG: transketolase C-terminal domain-containing protein [Spirochaetia bacterium]|jgi:transketolase|nr:transketolase C-terminal domain-containing protein [Spirochaetia bacterium]